MGQPQTVLFSADQSLPYIIPGTIVQLDAPIAIVVALVAWLRVVALGVRLPDPGGRRGAACGAPWRVLGQQDGVAGAADLAAGSRASRACSRRRARSGGWCRSSRRTMASPRSSWRSSDGCIRSAWCSPGSSSRITFVGGEVAQITIKLPFAAVGIFQAMMLFFLLASDVLVRYRLRRVRPAVRRWRHEHATCSSPSSSPSSAPRRRSCSRRSANWWSKRAACSTSASRA